ncbi:uncharacterized protein LOC106177794 [Lingula anatina]|uniref:Uncharacterized protein LOC106177794 n=1 Tax=Lingula anatina TaxID=7574 RepID=A0A1S3K179_LINAN|nr:uncharacterized protein LOC106177794 [Lingula anatina]|eukprot:XP_013416144.1 uncharacterized protein LOC106177794 [Lingula anatina]
MLFRQSTTGLSYVFMLVVLLAARMIPCRSQKKCPLFQICFDKVCRQPTKADAAKIFPGILRSPADISGKVVSGDVRDISRIVRPSWVLQPRGPQGPSSSSKGYKRPLAGTYGNLFSSYDPTQPYLMSRQLTKRQSDNNKCCEGISVNFCPSADESGNFFTEMVSGEILTWKPVQDGDCNSLHPDGLFQVFPIKMCTSATACGAYICIQEFRTYNVLMECFGTNCPCQPLQFKPLEFPSACLCSNGAG